MIGFTVFNIENTTAEILILKDQTAQNIIEIGKRLIEAKENLQHGEYLEWLKTKVQFTERTAQRFMQVGKEFSNTTSLSHLGSTKLFLLAGLNEEDRQEVIQENKVDEMTTRELEQVVKEKKEIKKQLEAEKEYSGELQEAIKQKENQIRTLQNEIENATKPEIQLVEKEIVKEVVPDSIKSQVEQLEKERSELFKKYEEAKSTIVSMNNMKNNEIGQKYYDYGFDGLSAEIASFLRNTSKYTYMEQEYSELSVSKKTLLKNGVKKIETWLLDMKKAMNENLMIGNNIYLEEENEDEQ